MHIICNNILIHCFFIMLIYSLGKPPRPTSAAATSTAAAGGTKGEWKECVERKY
jgi:hypothetical protein